MTDIQTEILHAANINEQEFVSMVNKLARNLAYKFQFGIYSIYDMQQQGWIFALEALEQWDRVRPLENFLWTHMHNRMFNFKRDNYARPTNPCATCTNKCEFTDKNLCPIYMRWEQRNNRKKSLVSSIELSDVHVANTLSGDCIAHQQELLDIINRELPIEYRPDYLRLMAGEKLIKSRKVKLLGVLKEIVCKYDRNE